MKKAFKVGVVAMAGAAAIGAFALTGCDNKVNGTFTGEYHYNQYNTEYGVKVEVVVENDVIKSVTPLDSSYVEASPDRNS